MRIQAAKRIRAFVRRYLVRFEIDHERELFIEKHMPLDPDNDDPRYADDDDNTRYWADYERYHAEWVPYHNPLRTKYPQPFPWTIHSQHSAYDEFYQNRGYVWLWNKDTQCYQQN